MLHTTAHRAALLAAAMTLAAGAASAQALPTVQTVSAPLGFLDLCRRAPTECTTDASASSETLAALSLEAGQQYWRQVFARPGDFSPAPASAPGVSGRPVPAAASGPAPALMADAPPAPTRLDAKAKARIKRGKIVKPKPPRVREKPPVAPEQALDIARRINTQVNRRIRPASDAAMTGQADRWDVPTGARAIGDCEDYVLAKRRELIAAGVAARALSIAVVRTHRGEDHAVLLLATASGEHVLDNLTPWVLRRDQVGYEWRERQAPGEPMRWIQSAV